MSSNRRLAVNAIPAGAEDSDSDDDIWCSNRPSALPQSSMPTATQDDDPYSDICTLPNGNQRSEVQRGAGNDSRTLVKIAVVADYCSSP